MGTKEGARDANLLNAIHAAGARGTDETQLRDHFAGLAMQALLVNGFAGSDLTQIARESYVAAELMLAARRG